MEKKVERYNEEMELQNCLVCGSRLEYLTQAQKSKCIYCGKEFNNYVLCPNGHSVCDECHNRPIIDKAKEICLTSNSTNPYFIFEEMLKQSNVPMLGCHHAFMVAGALLGALKEEGTIKITEKDVDEIFSRISNQAIGGYCGLTGICGIAPAVGASFAYLLGSKCGTNQEQKIVMEVVSEICKAIADLTGPSCCKAYSWKSIEIAQEWFKHEFDILLLGPTERITCHYDTMHPHGCRAKLCPYYPPSKKFERSKDNLSLAKPENMKEIMPMIMDRMFSGMNAIERMEFISTMMPKCLENILSNLDSDSRSKLAKELLERILNILEKQKTN